MASHKECGDKIYTGRSPKTDQRAHAWQFALTFCIFMSYQNNVLAIQMQCFKSIKNKKEICNFHERTQSYLACAIWFVIFD